jgi:type II/IV secretion system protein
MFDPRSPYHRRRWHYDSDHPLSIAQLIAAGSVDARTAALLWVLIERHQSLIVSGPTDPTPGVGKTTTLNALLEFLPAGTTLVYTMGMYEDFDFVADTNPTTTCVLANEVSDHLPIYMWGRVARQLLALPADGYAIATSCHADEVQDVVRMLRRDLRLNPTDLGQVGVIVNIGLVGKVWPPRRRFLSVNYVCPPADAADISVDALDVAATPQTRDVVLLPLATWHVADDTFAAASPETLTTLADQLGMTLPDLQGAIARRHACLEEISQGSGAGLSATRNAIETLMATESNPPDAPQRADKDTDANH